MDIKNEIKSYIALSGYTMTDIIDMINNKYNKTDTVQNLSNKLTRGTIRYNEVLEIADVINYEVKWIKK